MKRRQDCWRISDVCRACRLSLARRASHPSAVGASCALRVTVRCTSALCVDQYVERVTSHASSTFGISKGLVPSPQALLERLQLRTCTHDSLLRLSGTHAHGFLS